MNVINSNASKGNAINGLCKYLKIEVNDVIAMGDDLNDISMMQAVGMGVAMGNAIDKLKEVATFVTKPNYENGIEYWYARELMPVLQYSNWQNNSTDYIITKHY